METSFFQCTEIFQNWGPSETARTVGTTSDQGECDKHLKHVKQWIALHHLKGGDPYFYSAKRISFSQSSYFIVVSRVADQRICPSNFDVQHDVDLLSQEVITQEKLHTPQMIYLPNYVTEARLFMKAILREPNKNFEDPCYRRRFSSQEYQGIVSQISSIFQISQKELHQCFDDAVLSAINVFVDQQTESFCERTESKIVKDPCFYSFLHNVDLGQSAISTYLKDSKCLSNAGGERCFPIVIGSRSFIVQADLTPLFFCRFLEKKFSPYNLKQVQPEIDEIKEQLKFFIFSQIRKKATEHGELREEDHIQSRISYFEHLTGVSLG